MLDRAVSSARWALRFAADCWSAPRGGARWDGAGEPVLLLHGFGGTPRLLRPLAQSLQRTVQRPVLDVGLGAGFGDIRDSAIDVHRLLDEGGFARCDVVGYSMGGLVSAYLLKCLDQGRRIRSVITLGTPYRGVPLISRWPTLLSAWLPVSPADAGRLPKAESEAAGVSARELGTRIDYFQRSLPPPR